MGVAMERKWSSAFSTSESCAPFSAAGMRLRCAIIRFTSIDEAHCGIDEEIGPRWLLWQGQKDLLPCISHGEPSRQRFGVANKSFDYILWKWDMV